MAVAASGGRAHHVIALWPVALRGALRHALVDEKLRAVRSWMARHQPAIAEWPAAPLDPFFNANTPADLDEAERLAALDRPAD
jgi:molybdopterin-guanine dinucleotide biosynthesis protein A